MRKITRFLIMTLTTGVLFVAMSMTALAAANTYGVTGGNPGALPTVGAAAVSLPTITITEDGVGDDFLADPETITVQINATDYGAVVFDQTITSATIGGDCGYTGSAATTYTSAYTVTIPVAGGVICGAGETITIAGLQIKTIYKLTAPGAAELVTVDNTTTASGTPIGTADTINLAVAAADAAASVTLGTNSVVGAAGNTTLNLIVPVDMAATDTVVFTMPDNLDVSSVVFGSETFAGAGTFSTCTDALQVITCTASGAITAGTGTIVMTGITSKYAATGQTVLSLAVNDTSAAGADTATDASGTVTNTTVANAAASVTLGANSIIGTAGTTTLNLTVPVAMAATDTIVFTMPDNLDVSSVAYASDTFGGAGVFVCADALQVITCTASDAITAGTGTIVMSGILSTYSATGQTVTSVAVTDVAVSSADTATDASGTVTDTTTASGSTVTIASMVASQYNPHTYALTTTVDIPNLGSIDITYPAGWDVSATNGLTAQNLSGMDGTWTATVSGQVITLTQTGGAITSAGAISFTLESIATTGTLGDAGTIIIETKNLVPATLESVAPLLGTVVGGSSGGSSSSSSTSTTTTTTTTTTTETPATTDTPAETTTTVEETVVVEVVLEDGTVVVVQANEFIDALEHWAKTEIEKMSTEGIVKGDPDGNFRPDDNLNRAEAAALVYRVLGLGEPNVPFEKPFSDVEGTAWYAGYLNDLKEMGLVAGNPDGTYRPNNNINRAEFLTLAMNVYYHLAPVEVQQHINVLKTGDKTTTYADLGDDWYTGTVTAATTLGFVHGSACSTGGMCFNATNQITRAEATVILYNMFFAPAEVVVDETTPVVDETVVDTTVQ